jgi:hypothetical protein
MTRKRISLDGSWEFLPDPDQSFQLNTLADARTPRRSIRVPGPWQAQFEDLRGYSGVASQQSYLGTVEIVARQGRRWQGDWASNMNWIRQTDMFKEIPSGGTVDFAFADLTPEHVITGISPRDFAADVHAGLFVGWLHHIAALVAERRYGNGRLLISTFRLREQLEMNPVAAIMLRDMIAHLTKERAANERSEAEMAMASN